VKDSSSNGKWFGGGLVFFIFFAIFLVLLSTKQTNVENKFQLPEKFFDI